MGKKMPKERYSKLPVSILRPLNLERAPNQGGIRRDPRFDGMSGNLNEGLFRESYSFIKDYQQDRINELKDLIQSNRKDKDNVHKLRAMLGEEKDMANKSKQRQKEKEIMKTAKMENIERVKKGMEPVFLKKRELKERQHIEKFEKLEKSGKLDDFIQKKQEENDRKRVKR